MQAQLTDINDIKIFILYLMKNVGYPLDFASINDIVVQDGFVSQFDFTEYFAQLLETGNISETTDEEKGVLYQITEQGSNVAETLESNLITMIREKSLKSAIRLLSFKERDAKLKFDFEILPNERFRVHLTITEKDEPVMETSIMLESKYQLEKIRANFYDRPESIYRGMLSVLTGEISYLIDG